MDGKIAKANQGIGLIKRLFRYLPRNALLQIYKSFVHPHLDYCDVIYHKPLFGVFSSKYYTERSKTDPVNKNYHFTNKIEEIQYNAALAITGCFRGSNREKLYSELGLISLYDRRRFHCLSLFYKIKNNLTPDYLRNFIPNSIYRLHTTRSNRDEIVPARTLKFRYTLLDLNWSR